MPTSNRPATVKRRSRGTSRAGLAAGRHQQGQRIADPDAQARGQQPPHHELVAARLERVQRAGHQVLLHARHGGLARRVDARAAACPSAVPRAPASPGPRRTAPPRRRRASPRCAPAPAASRAGGRRAPSRRHARSGSAGGRASSCSKPFMTESTTISAATPTATPEQRDQRDERHEAARPPGAQVAEADIEFEGAKHGAPLNHRRRAKMRHRYHFPGRRRCYIPPNMDWSAAMPKTLYALAIAALLAAIAGRERRRADHREARGRAARDAHPRHDHGPRPAAASARR
jgi:hypothetical protein